MDAEVRVAVHRVLVDAVIETEDGWALACPFHHGQDGLDRLTDAVTEAAMTVVDPKGDLRR